MIPRKAAALLLSFAFLILLSLSAPAQTPTTGRIAGTVKDQTGAVIVGAQLIIFSKAAGNERKVTTDAEGNYSVPFLAPGMYDVGVAAHGFPKTQIDNVAVSITETTSVNVRLEVGTIQESVKISVAPLTDSDGPQLGRVIDSRMVSELPLATRNFTQILGLSPGTALDLPDNTAVGRNSLDISVNGARTTQNNYQINGVDANAIASNNSLRLAVPAPETIQEFKVQTSLYDATFGRSGGGNIQVVSRSGSNDYHGSAYEYFRNDALNANNPFFKAANVKRPALKRNVFGALLGGPFKKDRIFFFVSYQGTRERNAASPNSLSSNILIGKGLTDDRSEQRLSTTFGMPVDPISLRLLNVKLSNGQFLIPTPKDDGRYSGSASSSFREDQFNSNIDFRINERNSLAVKFFFSNAPQTLALFSGPNVPGFGAVQQNNNRLISIQHVHSFGPTAVNELRIGYNFIRQESFPEAPVKDSDVGIHRANADTFPGLPLIRIAPIAGGVAFGTATGNSDFSSTVPSTTVGNVLSISHAKHSIRTGAELIYYEYNVRSNQNSRGQIDFNDFNDFLTGTVLSSTLGTGLNHRSLRTTDYAFFVQDDWRISSGVTLNFGLRYELDLPFLETRGLISTFDPSLYRPPIPSNGLPLGPPAGGFVQAGNVIPQYDLAEVANVGNRVVTSVDPNNFAPRLGFAYSPFASGRLAIRGGYGVFYSRTSAFHLTTGIQLPPNYVVGRRTLNDRPPPSFADPFFSVPAISEFPRFVPNIDLTNQVFDRNLRTPYFHQYNTSLQYAVGINLLLEIAYVGTRGLNLFRNVAINQARLASPEHPVINDVTGAVTTNTPANAQRRAPFQGVSIAGFGQRQTTAQSTYNSLQVSLTKRLSRGLQLQSSYTYSKSIDNASGGTANTGAGSDSGVILGNQLDNRANRGVSDFDRSQRFVLSYLWDLPQSTFAARSNAGRLLLSNWQMAGIITSMSGLPIDIVDSNAGSLYLGANNALSRPNWAPGETRSSATSNIPAGFYFNPRAFARPRLTGGQAIPSSGGAAFADATCSNVFVVCTDFGEVGRNVLRGPRQTNVDFSIIKRFPIRESKNIEFRVEFFNLLNHVNFANPISNLNAVTSSGGAIDAAGRITSPGDFGRIISTSGNPRLIQFALKFSF